MVLRSSVILSSVIAMVANTVAFWQTASFTRTRRKERHFVPSTILVTTGLVRSPVLTLHRKFALLKLCELDRHDTKLSMGNLVS